jgi:DNA-binding transcriptional MerR regulator
MIVNQKELGELTGATQRQLDYWARSEVIPVIGKIAPGSGFKRYFDSEIVDGVRVLVKVSSCFGHHGLLLTILKEIFDNYKRGSLKLNHDVFLIWEK